MTGEERYQIVEFCRDYDISDDGQEFMVRTYEDLKLFFEKKIREDIECEYEEKIQELKDQIYNLEQEVESINDDKDYWKEAATTAQNQIDELL
jgi:hypothetical protein